MNKKGSAMGDLVIVVAFVIVLGVVWAISGGADKNYTSGQPFLGFKIPYGESLTGNRSSLPSSFEETVSRAQEEFARIQGQLGRTRDFGEVSPYWGKVTIVKSSSGPRETTPDTEYLTLDISYRNTEPIVLTGWTLQSMITNTSVTIGQATKVSTSGNVDIEQPLLAQARDRITVLTGHSPIGISFQLNKCSGYLEQFQDFNPPISRQCPAAEDELRFADSDPAQFGDACLRFIDNLPRCEYQINSLPEAFPDSCHLFITEKINYSSCVKNHRDDVDFFQPEWRVYLKGESQLWQKEREIIRLLDSSGKTVDVFSY